MKTLQNTVLVAGLLGSAITVQAQPIIAALESGEVIESHPALQSDLDKN